MCPYAAAHRDPVDDLNGRSAASYEEHDCEDQPDDEQNPCDIRGSTGDTGEPKYACYDRDNKKYQCPVDHITSSEKAAGQSGASFRHELFGEEIIR